MRAPACSGPAVAGGVGRRTGAGGQPRRGDGYQIVHAAQQVVSQIVVDPQVDKAVAVADPFFSKCTNTPEAHVKADVTKVQYGGKLGNTVAVRGGGTITDNYGYTYDSYRRQNKTVENRTAQGGYSSGKLLPVVINMQGSVNWTEDVTTNAGAREMSERAIGFLGDSSGKEQKAIKNLFPPEFRNRLDATISFAELSVDTVERVVDKMVGELQQQLVDKKITIDTFNRSQDDNIFLAAFYWLIDVKGVKKWAFPFMVYGSNAIFLYVGASILGGFLFLIKLPGAEGASIPLKSWVYLNVLQPMAGDLNGSLLWAVSYVALWFFIMLPLYLKRIYIKL